jgi:hypothetical protein
VYDVQRATLRRLTDDSFAELQPVWSPDGRSIALVTDRFTTDLTRLTFGAYRLALIDVESGTMTPVAAFASGNHLNPQWSRDGRSLYFVSDHDGTANLYRVELNTGTLTRFTRAATGISGLTASSPSISVAMDAGFAALSVFTGRAFSIHKLPLDEGEPIDTSAGADASATAVEPPGYAFDPSVGEQPWPITNYKPRLRVEGMSQGALTVGMDRFGAAVGTGLGVAFSDVLNTHRLLTVVQVNQAFDETFSWGDLGLYAAYVNRARRWHWGLIGSSLPMFSGVRTLTTTSDSSVVQTFSLIRQTERTGTMVASYALNRARRIELQGGAGHLAFERLWYAGDGTAGWTTAASPLAFSTVSAAIVSDTTTAGATSVVDGERYRFEVAPVFGTLRHVSVLADYRRYIMPAPLYTIAARALHFGRYGSGGSDPRLTPLYLGSPALVRGYTLDSLVTSTCVAALAAECEEADQLLGNRIAVANLELRFPLLRPFGRTSNVYGPVPVEVALFGDAGLVWRRAQAPVIREPGVATSAGVTFRANVVGLGLGQFDIARRFRGPQHDWVLQFNLVPAF